MKRVVLLFLMSFVFILSGCNTNESDNNESLAYAQYSNVQTDIEITVINNPITTATDKVELEFKNKTDQEIIYSDESIVLEKKVNDGFVYVGSYGTGHEIASALSANDINHKTISIEYLEAGTYRFVFLQGHSTPEGPVYISSEFEVIEP